MRNRAAWILFAALLIFCAAMLGGCSAHDDVAAQSAPDLSVNISVPYATTTPTAVPEDPDQPFSFDANGRVTVLNERWIDEGFVSPRATTSSQQTGGYTQLRLGDQGQRVQQLQMRLRELGYYPGDISGVFDTLTEQAVQLFELTYGTMQTGIATPVCRRCSLPRPRPRTAP